MTTSVNRSAGDSRSANSHHSLRGLRSRAGKLLAALVTGVLTLTGLGAVVAPVAQATSEPTFALVDSSVALNPYASSGTEYTATFDSATTSAVVTATFGAGTMTYTVNGSGGGSVSSGTPSSSIPLAPGESDVQFTYTPNGSPSPTVYHLYLIRKIPLSSVVFLGTTDATSSGTSGAASEYAVSPTFSPSTNSYTATVPYLTVKGALRWSVDLAGAVGINLNNLGARVGWQNPNLIDQSHVGDVYTFRSEWTQIGVGSGQWAPQVNLPTAHGGAGTDDASALVYWTRSGAWGESTVTTPIFTNTTGSLNPLSDLYAYSVNFPSASSSTTFTTTFGSGSLSYTLNGGSPVSVTSGVASASIAMTPGESHLQLTYTPTSGSSTVFDVYLLRKIYLATLSVQGTTDPSASDYGSSTGSFSVTPTLSPSTGQYTAVVPNTIIKARMVWSVDLTGATGITGTGARIGWGGGNQEGPTNTYTSQWETLPANGGSWGLHAPQVGINTTHGSVGTGDDDARVDIIRASVSAASALAASIDVAAPTAGQLLTASVSGVDGAPTPTIAYQWQALVAQTWTSIGTGVTYTPSGSDVGHPIRVVASATNGYSTPASATSTATSSVQLGLPSAPTAVVATAGDGQAVVTWAASDFDGGTSIDRYTVTSSPGGFTCSTPSGSILTCTVSGVANGTAYTFTVAAHNSVGDGAASVASAEVAPQASGGNPAPFVATPTPTPTPTPSASATPIAVPTPTPTASVSPSASPTVKAPAGFVQLSAEEKASAQTPVVNAPLSTSVSSAPVVTVPPGTPVAPVVSGLPVSTSLKAGVKAPKSTRAKEAFVIFGTTRSNDNGRAKVPAFKPSRSGTYTIQLATADGKAFYLKVQVAAKKASSTSSKPASSSGKTPVKPSGKQG